MFPVAEIDDSVLVKEQVFGLTFGDAVRAYRRSEVSLAGVVNDSVGGQAVVLVALEGGRGAIRAYDGGDLNFEPSGAGTPAGQQRAGVAHPRGLAGQRPGPGQDPAPTAVP